MWDHQGREVNGIGTVLHWIEGREVGVLAAPFDQGVTAPNALANGLISKEVDCNFRSNMVLEGHFEGEKGRFKIGGVSLPAPPKESFPSYSHGQGLERQPW